MPATELPAIWRPPSWRDPQAADAPRPDRRLASAKQILQPRPVNLNRLVLSMGNMLARLMGNVLEVLPAEDLWTVWRIPAR
jgi:hypothetical protein